MEQFENIPQPDHRPYVRTVTLPSGKTIEVLSFEEPPAPSAELHVCPDCSSQLVYPLAWQEADDTSWKIVLRCPNCEWTLTDVFGDDLVQRFDEMLDRGTEALVADLRRLTRSNMEDDVERFAAALAHDHVLPEDF
jgi:hypothetical protein